MLFHEIIAQSRDWIDFPETDPILDLLGPAYSQHRLLDLNFYFQRCSEAVPFILDETAIDLIDSIESTDADILSLAREINFPFDDCWFEFDVAAENGQRSNRFGCLVSRRLFLVFVGIGDQRFVEPVYAFNPNGPFKDGIQEAMTIKEFLDRIDMIQGGLDWTKFREKMYATTLMVARIVVNAILLMNAKDSPISKKSENGLSRQARRAMSRKSEIDMGALSNVTRITLNDIGREHIRLLSEEAAAHPERRTHLVRGHLMRTGSGNSVWRRSHIRGSGAVGEMMRIVSAGGARKTEFSE